MMVTRRLRGGTMDRWIARASVAVVLGSVLVVAATLVSLGRAVERPGGPTGYRVGELVDLPLEWFRTSGKTLVVFLRSDCPASQSLAAALPDLLRRLPVDVAVLAVVSDTLPERERAFAQAAGFEPRSIRTAPFHRLRLRLVPTIALIDGHGRVTMARLPDETDVLAEMAAGS